MSHQDPYGNPPGPPYGQQPYGQQPPGQPYAAGPGFGGPGHPPPPQQRKTGVIIGATVAALVVIGGLVVGGIVLLGDDDDKSETASDSKTDEPSDEASEEPTDEATDEPTDEPTEEPVDDSTVAGTNYTYSLPGDQWRNATAALIDSGTAVDSGVVWGEKLEGSRANVLVEAGSADGTTLDEQRDAWESNLRSGDRPELERLPNVNIDGESAYAVQRQGPNSSGRETFQTVYLTIHQDIVYSISFTSLPADDKAEEAFDVVKGSWAWTS